MGLKLLNRFLQRHSRFEIDTSIFIYAIERNPRYAQISVPNPRLAGAGRPCCRGFPLTMTECLVQPYRGNEERRVNEYFAL